MLEITRTGDWDSLISKLSGFGNNLKREVEQATKESGELIVDEIVKIFEQQGPGWAAHGSWRRSQIEKQRTPKLSKLSRKELVGRSEALGIPTREQMSKQYRLSKRQLAGRLVRGGSQILVDTGALMSSAKAKVISWDHGRVGMNRKQRGGNLAIIHEFGAPTKRIPARPFFTPGFEKAKPQIIKKYGDAVKRAFGK